MKTNVYSKDSWIADQLAGIRMLERELTEAFALSGPGANEDLWRRVDALNSWLDLVDDALTLPNYSPSRPTLRGGRILRLPPRSASSRLPAA
jgi:hypothetical protein